VKTVESCLLQMLDIDETCSHWYQPKRRVVRMVCHSWYSPCFGRGINWVLPS